MKLLHKYGTRRNEIRRARKELYGRLSLVVAALVFFAMMFLITQFRPRTGETESSAAVDKGIHPDSTEYMDSLRKEVDSLYAEYESKIAEGVDEMEAMQLLEKAITLLQEVIRLRASEIASRSDMERLDQLQSKRHEVMGSYLLAQSLRQEEEARSAWDSGNPEEATRLLQSAISLQKKINEQYTRSSSQNSSRLHALSGLILSWQTKPIAERADALREEAYQLADAGEYQIARRKIRQALNEQKTIQQEYRQSRYATLRRMSSFEEAVVEIDTAEDVAAVANHLEAARQALQAEDPSTAFVCSEQAELLQLGILEKFGADDEEQAGLLLEIQALKDTAASTEAYHRIQSLRNETRESLRKRDMESFKTLIAEWSRESRVFVRRYKQSRFQENMDTSEVELLYRLRVEIPSILAMVLDNLKPVPDHQNRFLFNTEVSQALYESVTGVNPSSIKDALNPVDSITWEEAVNFNRMLSMILAHPVFLPDKDLYLAALGDIGQQATQSHAWSSVNSSRLVQPCGKLAPNAAGFHDLLGNVAEWLQPGSSGDTSKVRAIGGSARDSSARLNSIPEEYRSPDERNRFIGFRFVVDYQSVSE